MRFVVFAAPNTLRLEGLELCERQAFLHAPVQINGAQICLKTAHLPVSAIRGNLSPSGASAGWVSSSFSGWKGVFPLSFLDSQRCEAVLRSSISTSALGRIGREQREGCSEDLSWNGKTRAVLLHALLRLRAVGQSNCWWVGSCVLWTAPG